MYHIELAQLFFSLPYIYPPIWQYGMVAETDKELAKTKSNKGVEGGMDDMVRRWSLQLPRSQVLSLFFSICEQKETERCRTCPLVLFFIILFFILCWVVFDAFAPVQNLSHALEHDQFCYSGTNKWPKGKGTGKGTGKARQSGSKIHSRQKKNQHNKIKKLDEMMLGIF